MPARSCRGLSVDAAKVCIDRPRCLFEFGDLKDSDACLAKLFDALTVGDEQGGFSPGDDDLGDAGGEDEVGAGLRPGTAFGARLEGAVDGGGCEAGVVTLES